MIRKPWTIYCALFLMIVGGCSTAPKTMLNSKIPENSNIYQADFLELAKYIAKNHCCFYKEPLQIMSLEQYASLVEKTYNELSSIGNENDFYIKMQWFVEKLKDGHTRISYLPRQYAEIGAWWIGDKLIITSTSNQGLSELQYKEIVKIGGICPLEYEEKINEYIPADKGQIRFKRLFSPDLMLSKTYLEMFGLLNSGGSVAIEYSDGTSTQIVNVNCSKKSPNSYYNVPEMCRNEITKTKEGNWYRTVDGYSALYVQLNSLPSGSQKAFWEKLFGEAKQQKIKSIILDLRNNAGGNSKWCDEFLSYLVDGEKYLYIYKGWQSSYPFSNAFVTNGINKITPVSNGLHFDGKIILFTSPRTFSSATFFAVALKDNKMGMLLGEPVGNASIRYGFMSDPIVLKNTRLNFSTTHYIWARSLPGAIEKEGPYIMPDELIEISLNGIKNRKDEVFDRAMEIIGKN